MQFGNFRLGLRTLKTALAVMLIITSFYFFNRPPFVACLAAVFALRESWDKTLNFAKVRLISNTVGGAFALFYFIIHQQTHQAAWVSMILLPLLVIVVIVLLDGFNYNSGVIGAMAALLMISLNIPAGATIVYVIDRIIDTFIGVIIAIAINRFWSPKKAT
ncbi:membrane protein [Leuconostoc mesenteroides P45]|uniref:FUSC family protein n=1 Tax=Leuconostoc mesenteroides TaxID=1245 RepID=UPI000504D71E|nr:aromatic acid exporter family protein [Leuconostoc mesenteroides]KGB49945.1 membrane protein [Leuconostoc mesenteroides P45]